MFDEVSFCTYLIFRPLKTFCYSIPDRSFLLFRPAPLHKRAQCLHTPDGQFADRANTKLVMGGGVQISHHGTPSHVLRERGGCGAARALGAEIGLVPG